MNPGLLLLISLLGAAGFGVLLFVGLRMLREEQASKQGQGSGEPKAAPLFGGAPKTQAHEVLRVLRDDLSGRLLVEIAGKRYAKISDIQDPNVGQGFVTTLRDLQKFAAGVQAAAESSSVPQMPAAPLSPPPTSAPTPTPPPAATSLPPVPRPDAYSASLPPQLELPSMNPFKQAQILRERAKNPPPPMRSITEQINDVLQEKIKGTSLVRRGLRVRSGLRGDAVFELDGRAYEGVGEVPDPDVQEIIRAAIKEWESKQ